MFDDLEAERPLDKIMREGLARMDAAVEEVIDRLAPEIRIDQQWDYGPLGDDRPRYEFNSLSAEYLGMTYKQANRIHNFQMSKMIEDMVIDGPVGMKVDPDGRVNYLSKKDIFR